MKSSLALRVPTTLGDCELALLDLTYFRRGEEPVLDIYGVPVGYLGLFGIELSDVSNQVLTTQSTGLEWDNQLTTVSYVTLKVVLQLSTVSATFVCGMLMIALEAARDPF